MAMPQRDNWIDILEKTQMLLEYAIAHNDTAEIERLQAKLRRLAELGNRDGGDECKPVWNGEN